jgi:hypothetical protein
VTLLGVGAAGERLDGAVVDAGGEEEELAVGGSRLMEAVDSAKR